jgi:hypothetical protein
MALWSTQPLTEMSTSNISWGINAAGVYGWQPTTFVCWLCRNLGASTSWNPLGLSRPSELWLYQIQQFKSFKCYNKYVLLKTVWKHLTPSWETTTHKPIQAVWRGAYLSLDFNLLNFLVFYIFQIQSKHTNYSVPVLKGAFLCYIYSL